MVLCFELHGRRWASALPFSVQSDFNGDGRVGARNDKCQKNFIITQTSTTPF